MIINKRMTSEKRQCRVATSRMLRNANKFNSVLKLTMQCMTQRLSKKTYYLNITLSGMYSFSAIFCRKTTPAKLFKMITLLKKLRPNICMHNLTPQTRSQKHAFAFD